jgi:5-oxopent-3-ene-1,2,5-tricarboxylate decarboxylase/2-hydroxyhepta-2,4-diene-1,7-dioate isomerase
MPDLPALDFAPYRLSGTIYGALLNDPSALAALGDAVHRPPYSAPPKSPVLCVKPRNTLAKHGDLLRMPAQCNALVVGASLGLVIGRTACRVRVADAGEFIAGYTIVNDVSVAHDNFYRPSIRCNARDGFCPIGPHFVPAPALHDPDALPVRIYLDDEVAQITSTSGRIRPTAELLAAVTDFMTLQPGDILALGASADAPHARAGQLVAIDIPGVGRLENRVIAEESLL